MPDTSKEGLTGDHKPNITNATADGSKPMAPKESASGKSAAGESTDLTATLVNVVAGLEARTRNLMPVGATVGLDETDHGGRYIKNGKLVNANNRELNEDGSLKHPEQIRTDAFGREV